MACDLFSDIFELLVKKKDWKKQEKELSFVLFWMEKDYFQCWKFVVNRADSQ